MTKEQMQKEILAEYKKGNLVFSTGLEEQPFVIASMDTFLSQPVEGILYDLNRLEEVVMTFIEDIKWINDFAVCKTIRALKARIAELEGK